MSKPPIERFLALVTIHPGACWAWNGSQNKIGYGQFVLDARRGYKKIRMAPYRFIWEWVSDISMGELEPDHTCNNRNCVNPQHIEPVTHAENQRRSYERGRARPGRDYPMPNVHGTHCPHGHEYTPENTKVTKKNSVQCRACNRVRCLAYQAKRRLMRGTITV